MYLGGVISGPEDGVISDRNLRTRWQNEFRLLLGCCGGASRSDSNPPQQPQTYVWVATARVRPSANSRLPAGGSGVPKEGTSSFSRRGSKTALGLLALHGVFHQKGTFTRSRGGFGVNTPSADPPKTRGFSQCAFRPLKNTRLLPSETQKTR
jgi:hypothetical protein